MSMSNRIKEKFFLSLVKDGTLNVKKSGQVVNMITGNILNSKSGDYYRVNARGPDGKTWSILKHRLVYLVHKGRIPSGYEINHKDGVKSNCRVSNLEAVTPQENIKHSIMNGLYLPLYGEDNSNALFKNKEVLKFRKDFKKGKISIHAISKIKRVHKVTVMDMLYGKTYGNVGHIVIKSNNDFASKSVDNRVIRIRKLYKLGLSDYSIARETGIPRSTVGRLRRKHLSPSPRG